MRAVLEAKELFDRIVSRQAHHPRLDRAPRDAAARAARAHPRHLRPRRARGPLPSVPAAEEEPRHGRARGGARAARGLDLELRPRQRDAAGGPDPRAVGLHLPQRGEGHRRRQGGDRGRARHPGRAPRRRPRAARARAPGLLRAGLRALDEGREGEAALEVRALLRLPGAGRDPARAARTRTATSRCGAGSRRASCRWPWAGRPRTPSSTRACWRRSRRAACDVPESPGAEVLRHAGRIAFKNNVRTSIENEVHRVLKDAADAAAAQVFAENVRRLLLEPPFGPRPVLGIDPGVRTGCKLAAVDGGRRVQGHRGRPPADGRAEGRRARDASRGSPARRASRPSRSATARAAARPRSSRATRCARPALDVAGGAGQRGRARASTRPATSRARSSPSSTPRCAARSRSRAGCRTRSRSWSRSSRARSASASTSTTSRTPALQKALDAVVEDARQRRRRQPQHRLAAPAVARRRHRAGARESRSCSTASKQGLFRSRQQLLDVKQFGPKAFEQSAGFLRVPDGEHPLDNTGGAPGALRGARGARGPARQERRAS